MKNKRLVIIGAGGHAKVLISVIQEDKLFDIVGFTELNESEEVFGVPYLGSDDQLGSMMEESDCHMAALGLGYIKINNHRNNLYNYAKKIGYTFPPIISKKSNISDYAIIGNATAIFPGVVVNPDAVIGTGCILNTNSTVEHDVNIGDFVHISPSATVCGGVKIGENTIIGAGAVIIQSVSISANTFIGAGSVVLRSLTEPGIYVGVPAKKIA
ncbi:MAG: acetyltransferase [Ignavibacteriaceae bacterium]|nr:acetyltransferase [Ignavibacteriaceae bacterium]